MGSILRAPASRESKRRRRGGRATRPAICLKLYIYGYLNRVRSSRRLEREAQRNIEVIWLVRGLKPDFKTIADFRRANCGAFKSVFRQFVLLCRRLDLYGRELLAVDGTRIKAVNNKDRNFTRSSLRAFIRAADERLNEYLERLDHGDVEDGATNGGARTKNLAEKIAALGEKRGRYQAMLAQLERTDEDSDLADRSRQPRHGRAYQGRRWLQRPDRRRREAQADRRAGGDQPGRRHGPLDADRRTGPPSPGRRDDRRRRRSRLLQNRGHRGLREGRLHSARSQTATRLLGPRGLLSQGRVSLRRRGATPMSARPGRR